MVKNIKDVLGTYHEVFLPLSDVYDESGPDAFKYLERKERLNSSKKKSLKSEAQQNLVVINFNILNELHEFQEKYHSNGASDTLTYIKGLKDKKKIFNLDEQYTIYKVSEGLDLMVLEGNDYSYSKVDPRSIKEKVEKSAHFGAFKILTGDSLNHIKYDSKNGLQVEDPEFLMVNENIVHEGIIMVNNDMLLAKLLESEKKSLPLEQVVDSLGTKLFTNQFLRFSDGKDGKELFARVTGTLDYNKDKSRIRGLINPVVQLLRDTEHNNRHPKLGEMLFNKGVLGVTPRDMEQYLALQYGLLNNDVSLFFLCGKAGSGKTLLTYATAVDSILNYGHEGNKKRGFNGGNDRGFYKQIILLKPPEILGGSRRDPGALPGSLFDKLSDHLAPYSDAHHETILRGFPFEEMFRHPVYETKYGPARNPKVTLNAINGAFLPKEWEAVKMAYSGFIGGSSISDTYIIVDEAQDFSPYELKTIIERVAERSKIIICGDPKQTRNPKCNVKKNGLTYAIKHFLPKDYSSLVYLPRNYRSQAAEDAEKLRIYNTG